MEYAPGNVVGHDILIIADTSEVAFVEEENLANICMLSKRKLIGAIVVRQTAKIPTSVNFAAKTSALVAQLMKHMRTTSTITVAT